MFIASNSMQYIYCNVREFIISTKCNLVQRYPLDNLPDSNLFDIHHFARFMLLHKKVVPSYDDGRGYLTVEKLSFEPYYQLVVSPSVSYSIPTWLTSQLLVLSPRR